MRDEDAGSLDSRSYRGDWGRWIAPIQRGPAAALDFAEGPYGPLTTPIVQVDE